MPVQSRETFSSVPFPLLAAALLLLAAFALCACSSGDGGATSDRVSHSAIEVEGYDSPEEAADSILEAQDPARMAVQDAIVTEVRVLEDGSRELYGILMPQTADYPEGNFVMTVGQDGSHSEATFE